MYWFRRSALPPKPPIRSSAGDEVVFLLGLGARELCCGRPLLAELRDLRGHDLLDLGERCARPRRRDDGEAAGDLRRMLEGVDSRAELLVVDEHLVEARREAVGQDERGQIELRVPGPIERRRGPDHVDALLRDAVGGLDDLLSRQRRDRSGRAGRAAGRRECAEVLLDELLRLGRDRSRRRSRARGCWACSRSGRSPGRRRARRPSGPRGCR